MNSMVSACHLSLHERLDPMGAPALLDELPGLPLAFDVDGMGERLQDALLPRSAGGFAIERRIRAQVVYDRLRACTIRYEIKLAGPEGAEATHLAAVRVFPTVRAAERYLKERVLPLAARMHGRPEIARLAQPAAVLRDIRATVAVFPIDPDLPTLLDATNSRLMGRVLADTLPDTAAGPLEVRQCRIERGHYGRRNRCVLRYEIDGHLPLTGEKRGRVVYGKVAADDSGPLALHAVGALRALNGGAGQRFAIPEALHFSPKLRLLLLDALPGAPPVGRLLKMRVRADDPEEPGVLTLEEAIEACAGIAARLHGSSIPLGAQRTAGQDIAELAGAVQNMRPFGPELAAWLDYSLATAEERLRGSRQLDHGFSHGDFKVTQLLAEGRDVGLVDFDTVCQAEPALDLGQCTAHLRVACRKAERAASVAPTELAENLCARFMDAYLDAAGSGPRGASVLRARTGAYELVSLVRLAVHSWQKLKAERIWNVATVLEERLS